METSEIYNWLEQKAFDELSAEQKNVVLKEMDAAAYDELHVLHKASLEAGIGNFSAADSIVVPPLKKSESAGIFSFQIPYWVAAACIVFAIFLTRNLWVKEVYIPQKNVQIIHDTVRLHDFPFMVSGPKEMQKKESKPLMASIVKPEIKRHSPIENHTSETDLAPDLGQVRTVTNEASIAVSSNRQSIAENVLAREFKYVRM